MGVSQHTHGTDNARCLIALALITGQVGRPGTGLHPLRGQNNVQGASDAGLIPMFPGSYKSVESPEMIAKYELAWGKKLDHKRGKTVVEMIDEVHNDEIKGMYIMGENPAMSDPDLDHARQALAHLEHLVVQDLFLTETAVYADVILPASAWPEKDGTVTNTNRQVQMGRQGVPPAGRSPRSIGGSSRTSPSAWASLELQARQRGVHRNGEPDAGADNISWDRVEREDQVTYPTDAPDKPGRDVVFDKGFPRPNGMAKPAAAKITPPDETPDHDYPFILTTGRQLEHWHTGAMTRRASVLDALEPSASAAVSRGTLEKLGLKPGDMLRVTTRRGEVELASRQDDAIPDGVVFIPFAYVEAAAKYPDQPGARSVRQDPGIQILRGERSRRLCRGRKRRSRAQAALPLRCKLELMLARVRPRPAHFANSARSASIMKSRLIGTASRVFDSSSWNTMCEPWRNSSSTAAR